MNETIVLIDEIFVDKIKKKKISERRYIRILQGQRLLKEKVGSISSRGFLSFIIKPVATLRFRFLFFVTDRKRGKHGRSMTNKNDLYALYID